LWNYIKSLRDTIFSLKLFLFSISSLLVYPIVATAVSLFSNQTSQGFSQLSPIWWISLLVASLAYGIGEEAGWRGFALPRLQARMNALWSIFILTIFHALWHIPFFYYRLHFEGFALFGFFIGMLAGGIIMTYLYNESGGKTLLPILFHTTWNIAAQVSLETFPEVTYVLTTLQMVAAVIIVIVYRPTNLATQARYAIDESAQEVLLKSQYSVQ
jgi:membrane protease YdiL (CAAX protease family)